jgi:plasmid stability protein
VDSASTRARNRLLEVRATVEDRQRIDRAVAASGTDLTGFVITHLRPSTRIHGQDGGGLRAGAQAVENRMALPTGASRGSSASASGLQTAVRMNTSNLAPSMATLTLRNVPDELVARLKQRAKQNRRSLNSEVIECLEQEVKAPADLEAWLARVDALRAQIKGPPIPVQELVDAVERESH